MSVERVKNDGSIRHDFIEERSMGSLEGQRPTAATDPFPAGLAFCISAHGLEDLLDRRCAIEIALGQLDAATHQVDVRVVKAGEEHFPFKINAACLWSDPAS